MTGLLSKLEHKTGEGIAYLHDQERQGIQKFIGQVPWEHQPLLTTLADQVGEDLGEPDGVIVFDPSAFAKKGTKSVGVARQWCGRLGKVENCQVGIYMAYVIAQRTCDRQYTSLSSRGMDEGPGASQGGRGAQGDQVPHPPRTGVGDARRTRRAAAALLGRGRRRDGPSHRVFAWNCAARGERYLLAVPSNTLVRDIEAPPPEYSGRGPTSQESVRARGSLVRGAAGVRLDDDRGPRRREGAAGGRGRSSVGCRRGRRRGARVRRSCCSSRGSVKRTAHSSMIIIFRMPIPSVPLKELARVAKAEHRIEECFEASQGRGGLGGLSGEELDRVASSPNPVAAGRVVPESGDAAGKKSGPPR